MKVRRFLGQKIYGYLDIDIRFFPDITFLTGINGSGKTTALNCIAALLYPKFDFLCSLEFKYLEVEIEHGDKLYHITCSSTQSGIILGCPEIKDNIEINTFLYDHEPSFTHGDEEQEYYMSVYSKLRNTETIMLLSQMQAPLYLGLNRRLLFPDRFGAGQPKRLFIRRRAKRNRGLFSTSIEASFSEAVSLAEDSASKTQANVRSLDREFQRKLLAELIRTEPFQFSNSFKFPNKTDISKLRSAESKIGQLPKILGLSRDEIDLYVRKMLDYLLSTSNELNKLERTLNDNDKDKVEPDTIPKMVTWEFNQQNFRKILKISEMVDDYSKDVDTISEKNNKYLSVINRFLSASKKRVSFDSENKVTFEAKI